MAVVNVKWSNISENTAIVFYDGGRVENAGLSVPGDLSTIDNSPTREAVAAWIDLGNTPDPADPPPIPPTNQELADDLSFQGSVFKAFAQVVLDEINSLRTEHALPVRTIQQLKDAIALKMP